MQMNANSNQTQKSTLNFNLTWHKVDYTTSSLLKKLSEEHASHHLLKKAALTILRELLSFMRPSGHCWPSAQTLASRTEYSRVSVLRALRLLIALGYIQRQMRRANTPMYTINIDKILNGGVPVVKKPYIPEFKPFQAQVKPDQKNINEAESQAEASLSASRGIIPTPKENIEQNTKKKGVVKPSQNDAVETYNKMAKTNNLPFIFRLDQKRKAALRRILDEYGESGWLALLTKISESNFLKGENLRGWRITFDWLVKDGNANKIIEGNYANSSKQKSSNGHNPSLRRCDDDRPTPKPPKDDWRETLVKAGMNKPVEDSRSSAARIKYIQEAAKRMTTL